MTITKDDCLSILLKIEDTKGINIDPYMKKLFMSQNVPIDVLKFIAQNKGIEVANFYEMLRKKHNQKKSPLYINILKETTTPADIITTLTCLLTQVVLYNNKLTGNSNFIKEVRAEEITRVLNSYFRDGNLEDCVALLKLIRADLLVLEYIADRRELQA